MDLRNGRLSYTDSIVSDTEGHQLKVVEGNDYGLITDEVMDATSFHQSLTEEENNNKNHFYLFFDFGKLDEILGGWSLFGLLIFAALMTIGNAFMVQVLQVNYLMNAGLILMMRSVIVVVVLVIQTRGTKVIDLDIESNKQIVIMGCLTLSIANISLVLCVSEISIAAAFALLMLINPLSLLITKNWKLKYSISETFVLFSCLIGLSIIGFPWSRKQIIGVVLGLSPLFLTYYYDNLRRGYQKQLNLITTTFLSNIFTIIIAIPLTIAKGNLRFELVPLILIVFSSLFYLLGLELVQRINGVFHNEFVHVLFYLYVLFGFIFDYCFSINMTNVYDLIGSTILVAASYYGKNMDIIRKFWNVVRYGKPQAPIELN